MKQYESGLNGERIAEDFLAQKQMSILARRYRSEEGEIDLILLDGGYIVFTEVKYRPHGYAGSGLTAITPAKQRRMTHAALTYLMENNWTERPVRFDAIEITRDGVLHITNAFMPLQ